MNRSGAFLVIGIVLVIVIVGVIVLGLQLSNNIKANTNAINDLKTQDTSFKNSLTSFNTQLSTLDSKLTQANNQLTQANNQISTLSAQVTTDSAQITLLKSQLSAAAADLATLKTQVSTSTSKITSLESQITTLNSDIDDLQGQIDDLEGSSSGDYDTLVSSQDYANIELDGDYVKLYTVYTDPDYDGYIDITGSIDPSSAEDDVYIVAIYEDDSFDIDDIVGEEDYSDYYTFDEYDGDYYLYSDNDEPWVKIYLVNTGTVDVDANNITVRYYYD